jgi:1-phosphofructokinase
MGARIITVTLNPAIDQTVVLETLRPGQVHRASGMAFHAGGKGVNVASCLADWGVACRATGFLGAANAGVFEALFAEKGIADGFVRVAGETRTNIKLTHDGDTTDINLPGMMVDAAAVERLNLSLLSQVAAGTIVLLAGSLPAGAGADVYARLVAALKPAGATILLDTSEGPLAAALAGAVLPDWIKPNRAELEAFAGRELPTMAALIEVAEGLRARGVGTVVVSLGAEGSLFVGAKVLHAMLPAARVASTVGAGDAMVAGIVAALAEGADFEAAARLATAFAVAKLGQAGPNLPAREVILRLAGQVQITKMEGMEG